MARIRTIKPDLWSDEAFVECSANARLLFVAALNFASDYGVLPDKPRQLKMQCFPGDSIDVEPLIDELIANRLWLRREAPDGTNVLLVRTFTAHQRVDKPQQGTYGDPRTWTDLDADSENVPGTVDERSENVRQGRKEGRKEMLDDEPSSDFDAFWTLYPHKVSKKRAQVIWRNLNKTDRAAALEALPLHVANWQRARTEPRFIKNPDGWLSGRRWEDTLNATPQANRTVTINGAVIAESAW